MHNERSQTEWIGTTLRQTKFVKDIDRIEVLKLWDDSEWQRRIELVFN